MNGFSIETLYMVLQRTIMITFFVMVMMLLLEYITVQSRGRINRPFRRSGKFQVGSSTLLGLIPGCLGTFTAVSMYIHRIIGFGALLAAMIATTGDEAFVMFSMIPATAFKLNAILIVLSLLAGLLFNTFLKNLDFVKLHENHPGHHHETPDCLCFIPDQIIPQLRKISFTRALLIMGGLSFLFFVLGGSEFEASWGWERITYLIVTFIGLFIVTTVPDHFLNEHLWKHTIKKHLPRIFIWTFVAYLVIEILLGQLHLEEWVRSNLWVILILALLVGIIPESGPHIIFITLFAGGSIPFSILLANSIVQDGHGALPLLAESGKSFVWIKVH